MWVSANEGSNSHCCESCLERKITMIEIKEKNFNDHIYLEYSDDKTVFTNAEYFVVNTLSDAYKDIVSSGDFILAPLTVVRLI